MGRLISKLTHLIAYVCVATIVAQLSGIVYLRATGKLDNARLAKIADAVRGVEPTPPAAAPPAVAGDPSLQEEPSLAQRDEANDLAARNLELREQAVKTALDRVLYEKNTLVLEKDRYELIKRTFEEQLAALREGALSTGRESVRLIWENVKPKQAKEQILMMLEGRETNEVITILTAMPISKRAKIISEFKTQEETSKLDEILHLILEGVPEVDLIDETADQIQSQTAQSPANR
jgi:hypothetical protein